MLTAAGLVYLVVRDLRHGVSRSLHAPYRIEWSQIDATMQRVCFSEVGREDVDAGVLRVPTVPVIVIGTFVLIVIVVTAIVTALSWYTIAIAWLACTAFLGLHGTRRWLSNPTVLKWEQKCSTVTPAIEALARWIRMSRTVLTAAGTFVSAATISTFGVSLALLSVAELAPEGVLLMQLATTLLGLRMEMQTFIAPAAAVSRVEQVSVSDVEKMLDGEFARCLALAARCSRALIDAAGLLR